MSALGPIMVDLEGTTLTAEEKDLLRHPQTGGVILFSRNYESPEQLAALTASIRALREPRLLIAVDHEGGRVQRFREGFTRLPPVAALGRVHDRNPRQAQQLAHEFGWLLASELLACGVDLSFAPVLDLGRGISGVIGDRALHADVDVIVRLARAMVSGMREAGMAAVGKHYPGHGSIREDSHVAEPVDSRPWSSIEMEDLQPFARMVESSIPALMASHVLYPEVDSVPAGFSHRWISGILRQGLGYQGAVFTDDLSMAAARVMGDYPARARAALEAGCDMALVCNHPRAAAEVLESLSAYPHNPASQLRMVRLHGRAGGTLADLQKLARWRRAQEVLGQLQDDPELELNL